MGTAVDSINPDGIGFSRGKSLAYGWKVGYKQVRHSPMRRTVLLFLSLVLGGAYARGQSPYETAADFAKYAMKLRNEALLKVEPTVFVPTASKPATARLAWTTNIVTTVFGVGEQAGGKNPVPNYKSCGNPNWTATYGGFERP